MFHNIIPQGILPPSTTTQDKNLDFKFQQNDPSTITP